MICRLCGRERATPNALGQYMGPNVCTWTESAECESVRVAFRRGQIDALDSVSLHDDATGDSLEAARKAIEEAP